jgi:hypothetical protein
MQSKKILNSHPKILSIHVEHLHMVFRRTTMKNRHYPIIVAISLVAIALTFAFAQQPGAGGQGAPPQGHNFPPMDRQMPPGGGGVAMEIEGKFIYVVLGNQLFKVEKDNLRVIERADLHPMQRPHLQPGQTVPDKNPKDIGTKD